MSYFSDLGLAEPLTRALTTKGYTDPTPIQRQSIPSLLEGRDLLGIAQTGTGKTAAFALPSLHRLAADPQPRRNAACRMLVLSPTRELAAQIADNMRGYAKYLNMSVQCVFGGVPVGKQARMLVSGVDVLVATPGRLLDLIDQRALTLRHVEIFVLDEADQMMDLGFIHALRRVSQLLPEKRQSLFFSATMPQSIAQLGAQFIKNPVRVEVTPQATTAERVVQRATFINQAEKQALLTIRLRDLIASGELDRSLVFTRTKHGADRVVRNLVAAGVEAAAIHGNKSQAQRTAALGRFRQGGLKVLVATDIAARGIDVSGVSHVFNFELPNVAEQYVHRIGRTARAGADGIAESFVAPDEKAYLRDIEKLTGVKLEAVPLPDGFKQEAAKLPKAARTNPDAGPRRTAPGSRGGERRYEPREEGEGRSRARRNNGPYVARTDTSAIRPLGDARRDDTRRSDGQGDRRPRPQGDNRASGEARPQRTAQGEGQRRPLREDGPRRDGAATGGQPRGDRAPNRDRSGQGQGGQRDGGQVRGGQGRNGPGRGGQNRGGQGGGGFARRDGGQDRGGQRY